jgi:FtsP/CotA-like multicopper oxidase with cupredoxin domain
MAIAQLTIAGAELQEPLTLTSENGVMDILMVAKAAPINTLPSSPTGWVYEICKRPTDNSDSCPVRGNEPNYYGGTLLRLYAGDLLKIHLVNQLPLVNDSDHAQEPGHEFLLLNPTNLHTHGMLVSPRAATPDNPTWGDNVFVLTFNSANGKPVMSPHMHSAVRYGYTDYEIKIPVNHPSGLFWFHPHAHGIALNQVTAGLAGIITVGRPDDYICRDGYCGNFMRSSRIRHMILKDTQVLANGTLQDEEDPDFCGGGTPTPGARKGDCDGGDNTDDEGGDFTNGKWYFIVNGQMFPTISMNEPNGEVWRITNTSGGVTYDLSLWNEAQKRNMLMQVLSVDGVSISPDAGMSAADISEIDGSKFLPKTCPAASPWPFQPVCARRLHMMPSSRLEVWVTYRDARDRVAAAPNGASAVFRTNGYQSGPSGDSWPLANLANVQFTNHTRKAEVPAIVVKGDANKMMMPRELSRDMDGDNRRVGVDNTCHALPTGHMRRIFYGNPTTDLDGFGLAYEEVDEHGNVVGKAATDVEEFNPMKPTICVPLGPHNSPVTERWQLINVATEDHNFHIHQTKFRGVGKDDVAGTAIPRQIFSKGVMLDNVPLKAAEGTCGNNPPGDLSNPIEDWRAGFCKTKAVIVEIPFAIAGDFVYHCHILEHEDGGMMARIRVRPN